MPRFFERLALLALERPDHPALVDEHGPLGYRDFMALVERASSGLVAEGVDSHSRVGITVSDERQHLIASVALLYIGAWQLTLATHETDEVKNQLAGRVRVTHIVHSREEPAVGGLPSIRWPLDGQADRATTISTTGGIYLRTSGTTGNSNIVPFTTDDIAIQAARNPEYASGRHMRLVSVEHNNSKRHRLYCLLMGATSVIKPRGTFDLARFCRTQAVTCVDMSMMHAADLAGRNDPPDLRDVDVRVGGSPVPAEIRQRLEQRVSPRLFVRYGSTESGTIALCRPGEHDAEEPVGRPVSGMSVEVVDDAGAALPPGTLGNIRLRAEGIAQGYLDSDEQTASRFRGGWFWPGDLGLLRTDGMLVVKGRSDEMMVLNGINIFPSEIERMLAEHPGVRAVAASSLKSTTHGAIPVAAVELVHNSSATEMELMSYARERLALRAPRRIVIVDALPRNSAGKVVRREIAQMIDSARRPK